MRQLRISGGAWSEGAGFFVDLDGERLSKLQDSPTTEIPPTMC